MQKRAIKEVCFQELKSVIEAITYSFELVQFCSAAQMAQCCTSSERNQWSGKRKHIVSIAQV